MHGTAGAAADDEEPVGGADEVPVHQGLEGAGAVFSEKSRSLLARDQYRTGTGPDTRDLEALSREAAAWIRTHRGAAL